MFLLALACLGFLLALALVVFRCIPKVRDLLLMFMLMLFIGVRSLY